MNTHDGRAPPAKDGETDCGVALSVQEGCICLMLADRFPVSWRMTPEDSAAIARQILEQQEQKRCPASP